MSWLPPRLDWSGRLHALGSKVARAEELEEFGELRREGLAVILGMSTVREGIDAGLLAASAPRDRRWLVLGGSGSELSQLAVYGHALAESSLRPEMIVIGIHPVMSCRGEPRGHEASPGELARALSKGRVDLAGRDAARWTWIGRHRKEAFDAFHLALYQLRVRLFKSLKLPLRRTLAGHQELAGEHLHGERRASAEFLQQ